MIAVMGKEESPKPNCYKLGKFVHIIKLPLVMKRLFANFGIINLSSTFPISPQKNMSEATAIQKYLLGKGKQSRDERMVQNYSFQAF